MKSQSSKTYRRCRLVLLGIAVLAVSTFCLFGPSAVDSPGLAGERGAFINTEEELPGKERENPENGLCNVDVDTSLPYLRCGLPAQSFQALREKVIEGAGFDFLAKAGDLMRPKHARSTKAGVAFNSRHKLGEAFDYNQEDPRILLVRETRGSLTYWRTYLRCQVQDGSLGVKANLQTDNVGVVSAYVFDFTAAADSLGWQRIPAQPANKEYWHYQLKDSSEIDLVLGPKSQTPLPVVSTAEFSRWERIAKKTW